MDSKGCPMDSFNSAFSPACPSLPFAFSGLMDNKGCPVDLNIATLKGLMDIKGCPMDSFHTVFSLLAQSFPLSLRD